MSKDGIEAFIGCVKSKRFAAPSFDEMSDAITEGWAGKTILPHAEMSVDHDAKPSVGTSEVILPDTR